MKRDRILAIIVAIVMVLSTVVVVSVGAKSTTGTFISKDGSEGSWAKLMPGEIITFNVADNSLNKSATYSVKVWNGTAWVTCLHSGTKKSDVYGDISTNFYVPGWSEIGGNPLLNRGDATLNYGQYNVALFDASGGMVSANKTITIGNAYYVKFFYGGSEVHNVTFNNSDYSDFTFKVYNWTGTRLALEEEDTFTYTIKDVDGTQLYQKTGEDESWAYDLVTEDIDYFDSDNNRENYLIINVTGGVAGQYAQVYLPMKLDIVWTALPTDNQYRWGDTVEVSGYLYDGQGNTMSGYPMKLYAPAANDTYAQMQYTTTYGSGKFVFEVDTGSGTGKQANATAGTWYVGTAAVETGGTRVNEIDQVNITNFISYGSFVVGTKNTATVRFRNTDDPIAGFTQTFNISVKNESWMNNNEYRNMRLHIGGLTGWYQTNEYDNDDVVYIAGPANITGYTDVRAYYEFDYRFNDTGTATVWASWPLKNANVAKTRSISADDNAYGNTLGNVDLLPSITGSTTLSVVDADAMNVVIATDPTDHVLITEGSSYRWYNSTAGRVTINVYGSDQDTPKNASINVTGCGLDIRINESDAAADNKYLVSKTTNALTSQYVIYIAPKVKGTLTITATNGSDEVVKDYTIGGLAGSVTTSVGDDLEIEVKSSENIIVTVTNGQYATVTATLFDEDWTLLTNVNYTVGDETAGNGLGGVFEFAPAAADLDEIGYIVVVAKAGYSASGGYDLYMYDIIEITPVHDLDVTVIAPVDDNETQKLTVGIDQDVTLQITDPDGAVVDDIDSVTGKIYDADNKIKQTITFTEEGDYWKVEDQILWYAGTLKITAKNNTGENEHDGTVSMMVELATFTYSPVAVTAGLVTRNVTIAVTTADANGDAIPQNTRCYLNIGDATDTTLYRNYFDLDSDGAGEFKITLVGDLEGHINVTLKAAYAGVGNLTNGQLDVDFPVFTITPDTIYLDQSNEITIYAYDGAGDPIMYLNLTLSGNTITQPDPVMTNADGKVMLSLEPASSGIANVTIARYVRYVNGILTWTNAVVTDSYVTITSLKTLTIALSKSPIFQGETLTVTVTTGTTKVEGASIAFGEDTGTTNSAGQATFTVPDPKVESAIYTVTATKSGYITAEKSLTVIKRYTIKIVAPSSLKAGEKVTFSIIAKGSPLAGATFTFNGKTYTSDGDGKVTVTLPKAGTYTVTASYEDYDTISMEITIGKAPSTPGFELLTLIIALGVAFILLRRRRR